MKGYKGFNKDSTCQNFKFKEGKEYQETAAELCNRGFHFTEYPLDVFGYYAPAESIYREVETDGVSDEKESGDTKRVCTKIKIGAKLDIQSLTKAAIDFIFEHIKKEYENDKDKKAASNSGYSGAASNSGDSGAASNSGDSGAASNSGNSGAALTTGYESTTETTGKDSLAVAWGINSKAKGSKGCYIMLSEWVEKNNEWILKTAKSVKVDGKKIKADTFYTLKNGKFMEVKE
jgi:hypothetical protein